MFKILEHLLCVAESMSRNEVPVNGHAKTLTGSVGYLAGSPYSGMIVINQSDLTRQFQLNQFNQSASSPQRQAEAEVKASQVSPSSSQGNILVC